MFQISGICGKCSKKLQSCHRLGVLECQYFEKNNDIKKFCNKGDSG
jgi:hypothetical protein